MNTAPKLHLDRAFLHQLYRQMLRIRRGTPIASHHQLVAVPDRFGNSPACLDHSICDGLIFPDCGKRG